MGDRGGGRWSRPRRRPGRGPPRSGSGGSAAAASRVSSARASRAVTPRRSTSGPARAAPGRATVEERRRRLAAVVGVVPSVRRGHVGVQAGDVGEDLGGRGAGVVGQSPRSGSRRRPRWPRPVKAHPGVPLDPGARMGHVPDDPDLGGTARGQLGEEGPVGADGGGPVGRSAGHRAGTGSPSSRASVAGARCSPAHTPPPSARRPRRRPGGRAGRCPRTRRRSRRARSRGSGRGGRPPHPCGHGRTAPDERSRAQAQEGRSRPCPTQRPHRAHL